MPFVLYDEGVRGQKNDRRRRPPLGAPRSSATLIDSARRKNARVDECEAKMQIFRGGGELGRSASSCGEKEGQSTLTRWNFWFFFSLVAGGVLAEPGTRRADGALASDEYFLGWFSNVVVLQKNIICLSLLQCVTEQSIISVSSTKQVQRSRSCPRGAHVATENSPSDMTLTVMFHV